MQKFNELGAQGDVLFMRVDRVPEGFQEVKNPETVPGKGVIVAHSETGHHHVMPQGQLFESPSNPLLAYMVAPPELLELPVLHLRDNLTHEALVLDCPADDSGKPVVWEIRRQRQRNSRVVAD